MKRIVLVTVVALFVALAIASSAGGASRVDAPFDPEPSVDPSDLRLWFEDINWVDPSKPQYYEIVPTGCMGACGAYAK